MLDLSTHFAAQLLLDKGLLSTDQLASALRIHLEQPSLRLTDALLIFGFVSFGTLRAVLHEIHPDQPVGRLLVKRGQLSDGQLEEALAIQEADGGELCEILVRKGACSAEAIRRAQKTVARKQARARILNRLFNLGNQQVFATR